MRTTARQPKVRRARGNPQIPVGKAVDARTRESFEAGVEAREEKAASLAEEKDLSWMVEGALAYLKEDMAPAPAPNKGDIETLHPYYYGEAKYAKGTPVIFSEAKRIQIVHPRRGPMRIVRHIWVTPGGGKFSIPLDKLQKDCDL
jgi:hypothetical protein